MILKSVVCWTEPSFSKGEKNEFPLNYCYHFLILHGYFSSVSLKILKQGNVRPFVLYTCI